MKLTAAPERIWATVNGSGVQITATDRHTFLQGGWSSTKRSAQPRSVEYVRADLLPPALLESMSKEG